MLENLIIWLVVIVAAVYLGHRSWKQWRAAFTPGKGMSCDCGCSCCASICDEKRLIQPRQ